MSLLNGHIHQQPPRGAAVRANRHYTPWALFNFNQGGKPLNLAGRVSQHAWSNTNEANLTYTASARGGIGIAGASGHNAILQYGAVTRLFDAMAPANSPFWVAWVARYDGYSDQGSSANFLFNWGDPDSSVGVAASIGSANAILVRLNNTALTGPTITAGQTYYCVAGRDCAGACFLWVDGRLRTTGTGATAALGAAARVLEFMEDGSGVRDFVGAIFMFAWGAGNPFGFGAELSRNPWQLFEPAPLNIWFDAPAAPGGFQPAWAVRNNAVLGAGAVH